MKPAAFTYHRPTSIAETVAHLSKYAGSARVLAGGQSLVPMLNMRLWRPEALIDINEVNQLDDIDLVEDRTILGSMVRYATVERSPVVATRLPLLTRMVHHIGDRQVRNRGTIGGALVQGDPTGEMPLACLVLDATVVAVGPTGTRRIPVSDLYEGSYATVLDLDELVIAVEFPAHPHHIAFQEFCRRHNDFAVVSVVATGNRDSDGHWSGVRIALGGLADSPVLSTAAAQILNGSTLLDTDIDAAAEAALKVVDPPSDVRGSAEYRRDLVPVFVRRVLRELSASQPVIGAAAPDDSDLTPTGREGVQA